MHVWVHWALWYCALCTEHRILAAIVVFAQISVNSCRCTHVPVTQFSILNVPIYLSIKSSIYLWEYQCTLSLFTCVPCSTSNQPSCPHTRSHCHCVTVSLTVSLCHCATVSLFHCVTVWLCHIVTVSCFCHCVAVSLCHAFVTEQWAVLCNSMLSLAKHTCVTQILGLAAH